MVPRRLFVAGATGAVGQTLVALAAARGVPFVAHARPASAGKLAGVASVAALSLDDPALVDAVRGCTTVVQLVGTMRKRFATGDTYETSDVGTTRSLVAAAQASGTVDHLILLSSVGAGAPRGPYLAAKAQAEALVVGSGIAYTILRPSAFEDREGAFLPGARAVTRLLGLAKYEPITLAELARALLRAAEARGPLGVALEGRPLWALVG